jgi:hypothetical protein
MLMLTTSNNTWMDPSKLVSPTQGLKDHYPLMKEEIPLLLTKEENNIEDSGEENSSELSLDTTGLCGADRHLFGHDPFTTQDALDAIPSIEDIPDLDY